MGERVGRQEAGGGGRWERGMKTPLLWAPNSLRGAPVAVTAAAATRLRLGGCLCRAAATTGASGSGGGTET